MNNAEYCPKCSLWIVPDSYGWGPGPHCGVNICSCGFGMPVIRTGDLLIDRNYDMSIAERRNYGYDGKNIMTIYRLLGVCGPLEKQWMIR